MSVLHKVVKFPTVINLMNQFIIPVLRLEYLFSILLIQKGKDAVKNLLDITLVTIYPSCWL